MIPAIPMPIGFAVVWRHYDEISKKKIATFHHWSTQSTKEATEATNSPP